MNLLLDTHLLLWAAFSPERLSASAAEKIADADNDLHFSPVSIWEIIFKASLRRADFNVNAGLFRRGLLENGYQELAITGHHALSFAPLPQIHKDPFDRMLIAQASFEGYVLLSADQALAGYGGPVRLV